MSDDVPPEMKILDMIIQSHTYKKKVFATKR